MAHPLHRRVVRRAFKLAGLRRWSHWEEGWPHLGLVRPEGGRAGAVLWRGREVAALLPARRFAEAVGAEVVIVGSGPSLGGQDLAPVPPGAALLLNGALRLAPALAPHPGGRVLAGAVADERFAWAGREAMREGLPRARLWLLSPPVLRVVVARDRDLLDRLAGDGGVILLDNLLRPWRARRRRPGELGGAHVLRDGEAALSTDPDRGLASCGTVAFEAMQVALFARPRRIGLAGVDIGRAGRFYAEAAPEPSFLRDKERGIVAHFALATREAARRGIAVECYSPASALLAVMPFSPRLRPDGLQATTTGVPTGTRS